MGKGIFANGIKWCPPRSSVLTPAYENLLKGWAGLYSVGDNVTMADVVLAPTVEAGLRWGIDFSVLPTVWGIYGRLKVMDAFEEGDWRHQEDTPQELRNKE